MASRAMAEGSLALAKVTGSIVMTWTSGGIVRNLASALDSGFMHIETKDLDFGEMDVVKFVQRMVYAIRGRETSPALTLIIKGRNTLSDPLQTLASLPLSSDDDVNFRVPGFRYYRFRFEDEAVNTIWKLARFEVWGEVAGKRL